MAKDAFTYDDFQAALRQKNFSPVYLFHGEEDFLVDEAEQKLIDAALSREERGFNLDIVYGSEADARDIVSHASSFPMMAARRIVVVREADKLANKELLSSYLDHPSPTTSLLLLAVKPDMRRKPFVAVKKTGIVIEFKPLREHQLPVWIVNRVKEQGRQVEPSAVKMLSAYVGSSLRDVQNELDKLYIYAGTRKSIVLNDVAAVVGFSKEFNVFELQKTIGLKDVQRSTEILQRMMETGESAAMIVVMLTRYFAMLWRLSDMRRKGVSGDRLASEAGVNPYFLGEYLGALDRFPVPEIEQAFDLLCETDEKMKSTSIDSNLLMQMLLIRLVGVQESMVA